MGQPRQINVSGQTFLVVPIRADGNCLFRAIAHIVGDNSISGHNQVKHAIINYIANVGPHDPILEQLLHVHLDSFGSIEDRQSFSDSWQADPVTTYKNFISQDRQYGSQVELRITATVYDLNVILIQLQPRRIHELLDTFSLYNLTDLFEQKRTVFFLLEGDTNHHGGHFSPLEPLDEYTYLEDGTYFSDATTGLCNPSSVGLDASSVENLGPEPTRPICVTNFQDSDDDIECSMPPIYHLLDNYEATSPGEVLAPQTDYQDTDASMAWTTGPMYDALEYAESTSSGEVLPVDETDQEEFVSTDEDYININFPTTSPGDNGRSTPSSIDSDEFYRVHFADDFPQPNQPDRLSCKICGKFYIIRGSLRNHEKKCMALHELNKNSCMYCHETFINQQQKQLHLSQVHPELELLRCYNCRKQFGSKDGFVQHVSRGHPPEILPIIGRDESGKVVLRPQHEEDRLVTNGGGLNIIYAFPLISPCGEEFKTAICRTTAWDVAIPAMSIVLGCLRSIRMPDREELNSICAGCSLKNYIEDGWVALPDLAFRLTPPIQGSRESCKFKWTFRLDLGDCHVFSPRESHDFIKSFFGEVLNQHLQEVEHLFTPTPEALDRARKVGKNFVHADIQTDIRHVEYTKHQGPTPIFEPVDTTADVFEPNDKFLCHICGIHIGSQILFERHVVQHPLSEIRYPCQKCTATFSTPSLLTQHYASKHGPATAESKRLTLYPSSLLPLRFYCNDCDIPYSNHSELQAHRLQHYGSVKRSVHRCSICQALMTSTSKLTRHMLLHADHPPLFSCPDCTYSSIQKGNLERHRKRKHGYDPPKTFSCPDCSFSSIQKGSVERHRKLMHGYEPPKTFSCPDCSFICKYKGSVERHRKRMHGNYPPKTFSCPDCSFICKYKGNLERHRKRMHGNYPPKTFSCPDCSFSCIYKVNLERHRKRKHGNDPPSPTLSNHHL